MNLEEPTPERFRALARSSPWRWSSVEFEWHTRPTDPIRHAWIRRPGDLRVEGPGEPAHLHTAGRISAADRLSWPAETTPDYDADGLVAARPHDFDVNYDAPYFENSHWLAMLDPAELADTGVEAADLDDPAAADPLMPVGLTGLRLVGHHGRPTWEAIAMPGPAYDPRCNCCALLSGEPTSDNAPWIARAASVVRLDVRTGICVHLQHLDEPAFLGLDVRILAVNADYDDALFRYP